MGQVVLIHGAWHGAWCWDGVARKLQRQHVSVEVVNLPLTGLADDVAAARVAIEGAGEGAVVCGHAAHLFGSFPGFWSVIDLRQDMAVNIDHALAI